eukprot:SAG11_NODE_5450_length_1556_cov_1.059025_1_plen_228_part_00
MPTSMVPPWSVRRAPRGAQGQSDSARLRGAAPTTSHVGARQLHWRCLVTAAGRVQLRPVRLNPAAAAASGERLCRPVRSRARRRDARARLTTRAGRHGQTDTNYTTERSRALAILGPRTPCSRKISGRAACLASAASGPTRKSARSAKGRTGGSPFGTAIHLFRMPAADETPKRRCQRMCWPGIIASSNIYLCLLCTQESVPLRRHGDEGPRGREEGSHHHGKRRGA